MDTPVPASRPPGAIVLRDRLIVALDLPTVDAAEAMVDTLGDAVSFFKIGMQLQFAADGGGLRFAERLLKRGKRVFLDAKLFDIEATVAKAVANVAALGVDFLTIHGNAPTIRAAAESRGASALKLFSVTVLTSLDAADLADLGFADVSVEELVLHRARKALEAGADGVIASGEEAARIRAFAADKLRIVTPGIRRSADAAGDQKRVNTPAAAIRAGADYLVVGRPITTDPDPRRAAESILAEIEAAL